MVQGVPAIGLMTELIQLCALYGAVEEYRPLDEYPAEEFTEVYLVKFQKLTSARYRMSHTLFIISNSPAVDHKGVFYTALAKLNRLAK